MALFDDEPQSARAEYEIGQKLDGLSVDEIERCIAMLRAEITRLEEERGRKRDTLGAAEMAFKPTMGQS